MYIFSNKPYGKILRAYLDMVGLCDKCAVAWRHGGGTVVAGSTVAARWWQVARWRHGGGRYHGDILPWSAKCGCMVWQVHGCSRWVVVWNYTGEKCHVLGCTEAWWSRVACVSCAMCESLRKYGWMVLEVGGCMEVYRWESSSAWLRGGKNARWHGQLVMWRYRDSVTRYVAVKRHVAC